VYGHPILIGEFIFLDRTQYDLREDVTILGCTLWTDVPAAAAKAVGRGLNDFLQVQDWNPEKHIAAHAQDAQ
jgi:hypothetical protein